MDNRIEQEISKTLECMSEISNIQVSPLFAENLSSKIAGIRVSRSVGCRNRAFYPFVIALMVVLNLTAGLVCFRGNEQVNEVDNNQSSIIATEYGIGSSYINY